MKEHKKVPASTITAAENQEQQEGSEDKDDEGAKA